MQAEAKSGDGEKHTERHVQYVEDESVQRRRLQEQMQQIYL